MDKNIVLSVVNSLSTSEGRKVSEIQELFPELLEEDVIEALAEGVKRDFVEKYTKDGQDFYIKK